MCSVSKRPCSKAFPVTIIPREALGRILPGTKRDRQKVEVEKSSDVQNLNGVLGTWALVPFSLNGPIISEYPICCRLAALLLKEPSGRSTVYNFRVPSCFPPSPLQLPRPSRKLLRRCLCVCVCVRTDCVCVVCVCRRALSLSLSLFLSRGEAHQQPALCTQALDCVYSHRDSRKCIVAILHSCRCVFLLQELCAQVRVSLLFLNLFS